jgi:hypothetical protein
MTLTVLDSKSDITKAHKQLYDSLLKKSDGYIIGYVGFQGGSVETEIDFSDDLRIWWIVVDEPYWEDSNKMWNTFGLGIPKEKQLHTIIVEANYEADSYNPKLGGALAKDDKGQYFLLHNGNIGGGRKGIGKDAFKKHYKYPMVNAVYNGKPEEFAVICQINSKTITTEIQTFVREVYRIKKLVTEGAIVDFGKK